MLKNYMMNLYNINGNKNADGDYTDSPTFIKNIDCDIQPYSKEKLLKAYGYEVECNKRIFCDFDINIGMDSIFRYKDKFGNYYFYEVTKIIDWDYSNMEIAALEVNDSWNLSQT